MAGLLVAIGVMGTVMAMIVPSWRTFAKREKEAELLFRGEQYMRAIELYQRQFPGAYPTDLDVLVEQRFLRQVYTDPVTGEPFEILTQGSVGITPGQSETVPGMPSVTQQTVGGATRAGQTSGGGSAGTSPSGGAAGLNTGFGGATPSPFTQAARGLSDGAGGIIGVVSSSTETSMLEYNGRNRYDEWLFVYLPQTTQPGIGLGSPGAGFPAAGGGASGISPGFGGGGGALPGVGGPFPGVGGGGFGGPGSAQPAISPEGRPEGQRPQGSTSRPGGGGPRADDGPGVGRAQPRGTAPPR